MNIDKFEEKAKEIIVENNLFASAECGTEDSMFVVEISSVHEHKVMTFNVPGLNVVLFKVAADNFDDLFDKALRVLKAHGPKATRERKAKEDGTAKEVAELTAPI